MYLIDKLHEKAIKEAESYAKDHGVLYEAAYSRGFKAGGMYALSHQWIDVDKELPQPPKDEDVLVFAMTRDSTVYIASYCEEYFLLECCGKLLKSNATGGLIKYWMQIPELTKE